MTCHSKVHPYHIYVRNLLWHNLWKPPTFASFQKVERREFLFLFHNESQDFLSSPLTSAVTNNFCRFLWKSPFGQNHRVYHGMMMMMKIKKRKSSPILLFSLNLHSFNTLFPPLLNLIWISRRFMLCKKI